MKKNKYISTTNSTIFAGHRRFVNGRVKESLSDIEIVDSENQKMDFRVGAVYFKKGKTKIGLWIEYQEENLASKVSGPVLVDEKNWIKIRNHINRKFRSYKSYKNRE